MHKFLPRYFICELVDISNCKVLALKSFVVAHSCLQLLFACEKFDVRNEKTVACLSHFHLHITVDLLASLAYPSCIKRETNDAVHVTSKCVTS